LSKFAKNGLPVLTPTGPALVVDGAEREMPHVGAVDVGGACEGHDAGRLELRMIWLSEPLSTAEVSGQGSAEAPEAPV
jgi:hypothetical protein